MKFPKKLKEENYEKIEKVKNPPKKVENSEKLKNSKKIEKS